MPISGSTALQALRDTGLLRPAERAGDRCRGGVGTFAVQLAKASGAEVTGVCSAAKAGFVRSLAADARHRLFRARISPTARGATT